jgi:excisionase family DNA binding protein
MKSADFMTSWFYAKLAKGWTSIQAGPMTTNIAPSQPVERLTYSVEEAARLLGISRNSAYEAVRRGELPTIRLGRRILVPRCRLDDMLGGATENARAS